MKGLRRASGHQNKRRASPGVLADLTARREELYEFLNPETKNGRREGAEKSFANLAKLTKTASPPKHRLRRGDPSELLGVSA